MIQRKIGMILFLPQDYELLNGDARAVKPDQGPQSWQAEPAGPLHTQTVSHAEIIKDPRKLDSTVGEELGSIFD